MWHQSFFQFEQRLSESSVFPGIARIWLERFNMPEQRFGVVLVEIKNNQVESWLRRGVLAGKSVAEPFEFSLQELVSWLTLSSLQPRTVVAPSYRLIEPEVGLRFVAKYLLGLLLE